MTRQISSLWFYQPTDLVSKIERCIDMACERADFKGPRHVFFRADDVAVPGDNFARLMELFIKYRAPLSLAVVPAWLTSPRWQILKRMGRKTPSLWCWHQHGWRHINHEKKGKKQEFGPNRPAIRIREDLVRGRRRLENLLEKDFYQAFTPPWNRCGLSTLTLLKELGYHAMSRNLNSRPPPPRELPDFAVNVDLHTRKRANPIKEWNHLFTDLGTAISGGLCGIMIHHQRMNNMSFQFMDLLLNVFLRHKDVSLVHLKNLVEIKAVK